MEMLWENHRFPDAVVRRFGLTACAPRSKLLDMPSTSDRIETLNKFIVGAGAGGIRILQTIRPNDTLTPDDALLLAAYLVSMAEPKASHEFREVLEAVQNT